MYCLDYAERPQLSLMLHELVFLECHSQFASYPYTFASYADSCKILQPCVVATVRMHSDAIYSSIGASRMKTFIKNQSIRVSFVCSHFIKDAPDSTTSRSRIPDKDNFQVSVSFCPQASSSEPSLTLGLEISLAPVGANSLSWTPLQACPHLSKNVETDNLNHSV